MDLHAIAIDATKTSCPLLLMCHWFPQSPYKVCACYIEDTFLLFFWERASKGKHFHKNVSRPRVGSISGFPGGNTGSDTRRILDLAYLLRIMSLRLVFGTGAHCWVMGNWFS